MTYYQATRRRKPRRIGAHVKPSRLRPFLRATTAVALSCGGVLVLLVVAATDTFRLPLGGLVTAELVGLGGVLIGAGWALSLPRGEAWDWVTGHA